MLTKGKGEDIDEAEDEDESKEEQVLVKKKGKVTITKIPKQSTAVFTRRTRGKVGKDNGDVVFKRPPLTFEENIKNLREGSGMENFKSLKYEIRIEVEKKKIEDVVIAKMGQWKYSHNDMA